jgi:hypothetical protein
MQNVWLLQKYEGTVITANRHLFAHGLVPGRKPVGEIPLEKPTYTH